MTPPTKTTLDDDVANMRKVLPQVVAEIERRALAAQPAPPTEALRLLRALLASHDALEDGLASFDLHNDAVTNLESVTIEARRYLAATEEGTP